MRKSDAPSPAGARDIGASHESDRIALAMGLAMALLFAAATLWLVRGPLETRVHEVEALSERAAATLASAVADDFAAAIALGIPLEKARGVVPYLESWLGSETLVSEVAILDPGGEVLYRVPAHARLARTVVTDIVVDGTPAGQVAVTPSSDIVERAKWHLGAVAIAVSLVLAVLIAVVLRLVALERVNLPQARLGASAAAAGRGVFADYTPPGSGPMRPHGQSAARLTSPLRRRYRQLMELTDEVRALDTSGRIASRIDAALAPLGALVFDRPYMPRPPEGGRLWWPLAALATLLATRPLVASFAADRIGEDNIAAVFIAATFAAFALGGLLGLAVSRLGPLRGSKITSGFGMLCAGAAIGITVILRDPYHFIAAQFLAGFFGLAAVAAAFATNGAGRRRPWRGTLVLVAAIAIGMPVGALVAEAEGRRIAFATIGVVAMIVGLAAFAGRARRPRRLQGATPVPLDQLIAAAAATLAFVNFVEINLGAAVYRENYAGMALASALVGAFALLPAAALRRRIPVLAAAGAALASLAILGAFFGIPAPAAAAALGLGLGALVAGLGAHALTGPTAIAIFCGVLLAALAKVAAVAAMLPDLPVAGGTALVLAAVALGMTQRGKA